MSGRKVIIESSRHSIESCTYHLHSWRPFQLTTKALDSSDPNSPPKPHPSTTKRPCLSDRTTSFPIETALLENNMSKLALFDTNHNNLDDHNSRRLSWIARKRRRRGSRSVSGRSSDRSGTRIRCCSVGASGGGAYATCSDFVLAAGTDSSGELFVTSFNNNTNNTNNTNCSHGDGNWGSDVSESTRNVKKETENVGQIGNSDGLGGYGNGNESGYGSEPGYRGDAEFGYGGDEFDEEEDDHRLLFWGRNFTDTDSNMEMVGENTLQKAHHRCRRKKQDLRMMDSCR